MGRRLYFFYDVDGTASTREAALRKRGAGGARRIAISQRYDAAARCDHLAGCSGAMNGATFRWTRPRRFFSQAALACGDVGVDTPHRRARLRRSDSVVDQVEGVSCCFTCFCRVEEESAVKAKESSCAVACTGILRAGLVFKNAAALFQQVGRRLHQEAADGSMLAAQLHHISTRHAAWRCAGRPVIAEQSVRHFALRASRRAAGCATSPPINKNAAPSSAASFRGGFSIRLRRAHSPTAPPRNTPGRGAAAVAQGGAGGRRCARRSRRCGSSARHQAAEQAYARASSFDGAVEPRSRLRRRDHRPQITAEYAEAVMARPAARNAPSPPFDSARRRR